jgi:hypothetical protein
VPKTIALRGRAARFVAAARLHAVHDARTLPDVRRRDRAGAAPARHLGTTDQKAGACHTLYSITTDARLNHQATVMGGVLRDEFRAILREFFAQQRALGKK